MDASHCGQSSLTFQTKRSPVLWFTDCLVGDSMAVEAHLHYVVTLWRVHAANPHSYRLSTRFRPSITIVFIFSLFRAQATLIRVCRLSGMFSVSRVPPLRARWKIAPEPRAKVVRVACYACRVCLLPRRSAHFDLDRLNAD
jgi:hypothetical protein